MERQSPLGSHAPLSFASTPQTRSETTSQSTSRILFKSHCNLSTESAREEPRLRRLLGHMSVYDRTRTFAQAPNEPASAKCSEQNELSIYLQHQVPSFEEFRAALQVQLETIAHIRQATAQCSNAEDYDSDEDEEDSDYDSYDGEDWSDEDITAKSDESFTDDESDGQTSQCTSPTFLSPDAKYDNKEEEEDLWAIRPLTPFMNLSNRSANS